METINAVPAMDKRLFFPAKELRSKVIIAHVHKGGYRGIVCFGCGNGASALQMQTLLPVIDISPKGSLLACRWWTPTEIHAVWPDHFDATSGHLPAWMMLQIAAAYRAYFNNEVPIPRIVPTGSGETITCLRWAFPGQVFVAEYNNDNTATAYDEHAPLNALVAAMGEVAFVQNISPNGHDIKTSIRRRNAEQEGQIETSAKRHTPQAQVGLAVADDREIALNFSSFPG